MPLLRFCAIIFLRALGTLEIPSKTRERSVCHGRQKSEKHPEAEQAERSQEGAQEQVGFWKKFRFTGGGKCWRNRHPYPRSFFRPIAEHTPAARAGQAALTGVAATARIPAA